jgi:tetratricopeptide (TPR) repeat protein
MALRLDPDSARGHAVLAEALADLDHAPEARAQYAAAIALDSNNSAGYLGLGNLLASEDHFDEAAAQFRQAIALAPENPIAHLNLAMALQAQGNLDEALQEFGQATKLGLGQAWANRLACQRLRAFRPRLGGLLGGRDRPANNAERLAFAHLCGQPFVARYAMAARLYKAAFDADPGWKDPLGAVDRVDAAVAAARAGSGQSPDADSLSDRDKTQLREQARTWLVAELARWTAPGQSVPPQARVMMLRSWQRQAGLAAVRDPAALARLPPAERQPWQELWRAIETQRTQLSTPRMH